jgi:hypothetical protein
MMQAVLLAFEQIDGSPACLQGFCGLTLLERNLRLLRHCGITRAIILTTGTAGQPDQLGDVSGGSGIQVETVRLPADTVGVDELVALAQLRDILDEAFVTMRASYVYDRRALEAILSADPDTALAGRRPPAPAQYLPGAKHGPESTADHLYGLNLLTRSFLDRIPDAADWVTSSDGTDQIRRNLASGDLDLLYLEDIASYVVNLRRALPVACFAVRDEIDRKLGWRILIDATQKGTLDWPAQVLHPVPENFLVRLLLPTPVTPNHVTVVSNLCAFAALALFWQGRLWPGVALALAVGVLDGVDGKLARVKLLYSRFGDRLDHVLDLIYEPLWYLAIGAFLSGGRLLSLAPPATLSLGIVGLYFADRVATGLFKRCKGVELFDRAPVDRFFRTIGARRNTNVVILLTGLLAGSPLAALWAIFGLTALTTVFHAGRAVQLRNFSPNGASET